MEFIPRDMESGDVVGGRHIMSKEKTTSPELMAASGDDEPLKPEKDRKFVEALSRGLDVLRAFGQGSAILGNQDIARLTDLPKPTVSRMTYTLTKLGYLSYNTQLEKYQLSSGVLALGYAYVSNLKVRQLAKPYMDEFARQTNMSIGLTCRDRLHMIYVENRLPRKLRCCVWISASSCQWRRRLQVVLTIAPFQRKDAKFLMTPWP